MKRIDAAELSPAMLAVRVGCMLGYQVDDATPALLMIQPRLMQGQTMFAQRLRIGGDLSITCPADMHRYPVFRVVLPPGLTEIAMTPSCYCESDGRGAMALELFGHLPRGVHAARAICDWTHRNLQYRHGSGDATLSACGAIARSYGVCRDFAHVMIALCHALDMPARYVAGYMPLFEPGDTDIGVDFHAYVEVHAAGAWHVFDPRHNRPHVGRIRTAHGQDAAADAAVATFYGRVETAAFAVWAYPVDPAQVQVGDPVRLPFQDAALAEDLLGPVT